MKWKTGPTSILLLALAVLQSCHRVAPDRSFSFHFVDHVAEAEMDFDLVRFRSFRKDGLLETPITVNGETRRSLVPPLPSRMTYTVRVPPQPVLKFSIRVSAPNESVLPISVDFRIHVASDGHEETHFDETVRRFQPNEWFDHELDLTPWAGKQIDLTFEARPRKPRLPRPGDETPLAAYGLIPVWGNPVLASTAPDVARDTFILISVDCLRADSIGTYGNKSNPTPAFDRFARDGVVYEKVMSSSSWTLPTHMTMLTGLPPSLHGVSRWRKLARNVSFLPETLTRAGYDSVGVVSGAYLSQAFGFERGFHVYRYFADPGAKTVIDNALELLHEPGGERRFLFIHLFDPHWPYFPPPEFIANIEPRPPDISDLLEKVQKGRPPDSPADIEHLKHLYDSEVSYVDRELGRFFDELRATGIYDRSLIILTADHGEAFYEHSHWGHSETLYEEIVRIPLIVKWPGRSPVGRVEIPVSQMDIFATILEHAELSSPHDISTNLRRLAGDEAPSDYRDIHLSEVIWYPTPERPATRKIALRSKERKYIVTLVGGADDDLATNEIREEELYDLPRDASEMANLLSGARLDVSRFRELFREYLDEARRQRANRQGEEVVLDDAVRERLKALGYIEQ